MKRFLLFGVVGLSCAAFLGLGASIAQQGGDQRVAEVHHLMEGISKPHCSALGKLLKAGPKSERDWQHAELHAALLNELGFILMQGGRCPDATWAKAAAQLRAGSAAVYEAVQDQDVDAARAAFKQVTRACATCHKAHRK